MTTELKQQAHTPGPWGIIVYIPKEEFHIVSKEGLGITKVPTVSRGVLEAEANARLIAAAPELLEALQVAYQSLSQYKQGDELCQIRAAIAKATGGAL